MSRFVGDLLRHLLASAIANENERAGKKDRAALVEMVPSIPPLPAVADCACAEGVLHAKTTATAKKVMTRDTNNHYEGVRSTFSRCLGNDTTFHVATRLSRTYS